MEYLVRDARITDVDRLLALCVQNGLVPAGGSPLDIIGLLRQLVYIPSASVAVAEAGHQIVGGAILSLRPSVRVGGFIGTIDVLAIADDPDQVKVADLLIEEMLRTARRKGCTSVEVALPLDPELLPSWQEHGFTRSTANVYKAAIAPRASTSRP